MLRGLRRIRIFNALNLVFTLRVDGKHIRVPFRQGVALVGIEEPWMLELLRRFLARTKGAFVDVGVNVGQTLVQVKCVDPTRQYIGFEPNPVCVSYVQEFIRCNHFEDCTIIPAALHRTDGLLILDLYHDYLADGTASVVEGFRAQRPVARKICVPAYCYATVATSLPPFELGVVKIDVEGAELDVLLGLQEAIQRDRPVLLIEVLPVYSAENTSRLQRQQKLEEQLRAWNYLLFRVMKEKGSFAGFDPVEEIGIHDDLDRCDYVALPCESQEGLCADKPTALGGAVAVGSLLRR